jgi:hypothetical protein
VFVVVAVVFEATMEDSDEPVAERSLGLTVEVSGGPPLVVEGSAS